MNRRVTTRPPAKTSQTRRAAVFLALVVLALIYNAAPAIGQTSSSGQFTVETANLKTSTNTVPVVVGDRPPQGRAGGTLLAQAGPESNVAVIRPDRGRSNARAQWQTSWGQRGSGNSVDIDMSRLGTGSHSLNLQVFDDRSAPGSAPPTIIDVPPEPGAPLAKIRPDRRQVNQGERVRFSSVSNHPDRKRRIVRSQWQTSWGPGGTGKSIDIDTSLLSEGSYRVSLEVHDDRGARGSATATLIVSSPQRQPPAARITPRRREVEQGQQARFDGGRSADADGEIQKWTWSIDGRSVGVGPSVRIETRNLSPGEYRVRLDVRDQQRLSASDEATLVVAAQPREADAAIVELNVSPAEVLLNQEVQIRAVVANRGQATLRNLPIDFYIVRARIGQATLLSLEPGESKEVYLNWASKYRGLHTIVATVNPDDRPAERDRGNNTHSIKVTVVEPPSVVINPGTLEVNPGETAAFSSQLVYPGPADLGNIDYFWRGPGDRTGNGPAFEIDTSELPSGRYKITLQVRGRRGFEASAETTLVIRKVFSSASAEFWLSADNQRPRTGQDVRFSGGMKPALDGVEYRLTFGDGKETEWVTRPVAIHRYDKPGNYTVWLRARRAGKFIGSKLIRVAVIESTYAVSLSAKSEKMHAGEPLTLSAAVKPPVDDVEFQFQFGDGEPFGWTREAVVSHTYKNQGAYNAFVMARIPGVGIVQSPPVQINLVPPPGVLWPWLIAVLAILAGLAAAFWRKRRRAPAEGSFNVVLRLNLRALRIATQGEVNGGYAIGLRTRRGRFRFDIDRTAPNPDVGKE